MSVTNPKLELDPQFSIDVYEELGRLQVDLDPDPLSFGPKRLNTKVAQIRAMLSRCENLFLQTSQQLHQFKREHLKVSTLLELSKKRLYDKDPEVRAGRSVSDRDAIATGKLYNEVLEVHRLDMAVQDLESLLIVIRAKRADLRDLEGRLRDQMSLCREEIGLGGRWGSKVPNAPDLQPGQGKSVVAELESLENLLEGVGGEIHLPPLADEDSVEVPDESVKPSQADPLDLSNVLKRVSETKKEAQVPVEVSPVAASEAKSDDWVLTFESKGVSKLAGNSDLNVNALIDNLPDFSRKNGKSELDALSDDVLNSLLDPL